MNSNSKKRKEYKQITNKLFVKGLILLNAVMFDVLSKKDNKK